VVVALAMACIGMTSIPIAAKPPPRPPPANPQIVFEKYLTGKPGMLGSTTGIYVMDANGANIKQLTANTTSVDAWPRWSPDGTRIAFCRGGTTTPPTAGVYVIAIQVVNGVVTAGDPSLVRLAATRPVWSPDGTLVVAEDGDLIRVDASSGAVIESITMTTGMAEYPCDYKHDAYGGKDWLLLIEKAKDEQGNVLPYGWEPAVIDMSTGARTTLATHLPHSFVDGGGLPRPGDYKVEAARFSPDFTAIAYSVGYQNGYFDALGIFGAQLFMADLSGLGAGGTPVLSNSVMLSANGGFPTFRPDGQSFVFTLFRSDKLNRRYCPFYDMVSMPAAGGAVLGITGSTAADEIEPDYKPAP
jgi:hypothetical protein